MNKEYVVRVKLDSFAKKVKMNDWCDAAIGRMGRFRNNRLENWTIRYTCPVGEAEYVFAREKDAVLFALKWK